jgi:hypothetical protein
MFLKERGNGHMVEVLGLTDLFDPFNNQLVGRVHYGEEVQDPQKFEKNQLSFLSGEGLPKCWMDPHYRDHELKR